MSEMYCYLLSLSFSVSLSLPQAKSMLTPPFFKQSYYVVHYRIHCVDYAGLKLPEISLPPCPQVLGLKMCPVTSSTKTFS